MSTTRVIVWSAAMLWVLLAVGRAGANHDRLFQPGPPDNHGHIAHWSWRPSGSPPDNMTLTEVKFFIHSHAGVPEEEMTAGMVDAIRDAAETWSLENTLALVNLVEVNNAGDADIHVHLGNLDGAVGGILGQVFHSFQDGHESVDFDDGHPWHRILSATLVMDSNEPWFGGADFAQVILHEFGHVLGLGHADPTTEPDSVMIQDIGQQGSILTADDLEALRHLYGLAVLLGDANNDLQVTGADLIAVQQNFGNVGLTDGLLLGDANDDGQVTGADLISVQQNFGNVLSSATVPEPGAALAWTALVCLAMCRRETWPRSPRPIATPTHSNHAQPLHWRTSCQQSVDWNNQPIPEQ